MHAVKPSHKALTGKIEFARKAVRTGKIVLLSPDIIAADLANLGREVDEISNILYELLENTSPKNYAGTRPPQRAYESEIPGCELYAFKAASKTVGCTMYFKFTVNDDKFWLVSLHEDRQEKGEK